MLEACYYIGGYSSWSKCPRVCEFSVRILQIIWMQDLPCELYLKFAKLHFETFPTCEARAWIGYKRFECHKNMVSSTRWSEKRRHIVKRKRYDQEHVKTAKTGAVARIKTVVR